MKLGFEWLCDLNQKKLPDVNTTADKMTLTGSKVEGITSPGSELSKIVTGKIKSVTEHPNADKLVICSVDVGDDCDISIVTGATNIYVGAVVPVALHGAIIAGNNKIVSNELRGVLSEGMLCSIEELGYDHHFFPQAPEDGIFILPPEEKLGVDIKEVLNIGRPVIEFEITSNRPDCFSVEGLAREAGVSFDIDFKPLTQTVNGTKGYSTKQILNVKVMDKTLCPRYVARAVRNIKIEPSPHWMASRLRDCGIRPINNIVDITNYVLLELGQPMHAFDYNDINKSQIIVRRANADEKLKTLDGEEHVLDNEMLVIADHERAVGMAGIMGGEDSSIDESTNQIILESANFNGANIRISAKKLGIRTESSSRFEKGLDPINAMRAMDRACELIEALNCGEVSEDFIDIYPIQKEPTKIKFTPERINALLGTKISKEDMIQILEKLECKITHADKDLVCIPPSFRPDLELDIDLAEEVARFYGYNNIVPTLLTGKSTTLGGYSPSQKQKRLSASVLKSLGFYEACTYSFMSPKVFDKLRIPESDPLRKAVRISNPLGEDFSLMRTTMIPSILDIASTNLNKGASEFNIFEIAKVYSYKHEKEEYIPLEDETLSVLSYSENESYETAETFLRLKGVISELFRETGIEDIKFLPCDTNPSMHPNRTAKILSKTKEIGFIGYIHPEVAQNTQTDKKLCIASINMNVITSSNPREKTFKPLPKYPSITRDFAVTLDRNIPVSEIEKIIKENGSKYLESFELFDVYTGKQIDENKKSVAYKLVFRDEDKTLKDEDVNLLFEKVIKELQSSLNAQLR